MVSPAPESVAGQELRRAQDALGCAPVRQGVSALQLPQDLLKVADMVLAGSPANHDPVGNRASADSHAGNVGFKEEVFYSLCWQTPPGCAVGMTWSHGACGSLDFRVDQPDGRVLVVAPAYFRRYKPRLGLADTLGRLSDEDDAYVALYAPSAWLPRLAWTPAGRLDLRRTLAQCFPREATLVTLGAYTLELEYDLCGKD